MIKQLYTIYDKVAEDSAPIFEAKNDGIALRQIKQLLTNSPVNNVNDYSLLHLGCYDSEKCITTINEKPVELDITKLLTPEVTNEQ